MTALGGMFVLDGLPDGFQQRQGDFVGVNRECWMKS